MVAVRSGRRRRGSSRRRRWRARAAPQHARTELAHVGKERRQVLPRRGVPEQGIGGVAGDVIDEDCRLLYATTFRLRYDVGTHWSSHTLFFFCTINHFIFPA
jgi:hypothetical protein